MRPDSWKVLGRFKELAMVMKKPSCEECAPYQSSGSVAKRANPLTQKVFLDNLKN